MLHIVRCHIEQPPQFVGREHRRQTLGNPRARKLLDSLVASQRDLVKELQSASGQVVAAPTDALLLNQMQQILAHLFTAEALGRLPEVIGELLHRKHVRVNRVPREIPQPHVLDHPLTKCRHR